MIENNIATDRDTRLKRLRMRAWRRGMKEMDIILGTFVDTEGPSLTDAELSSLETLMTRQDQQLFLWVSGASAPPVDARQDEEAILKRIVNSLP